MWVGVEGAEKEAGDASAVLRDDGSAENFLRLFWRSAATGWGDGEAPVVVVVALAFTAGAVTFAFLFTPLPVPGCPSS